MMNTPTEAEVGGDDSDEEGFPGTAEHPVDGEGSSGIGEGDGDEENENNDESIANQLEGENEDISNLEEEGKEETKQIHFNDNLMRRNQSRGEEVSEKADEEDDFVVNSNSSR